MRSLSAGHVRGQWHALQQLQSVCEGSLSSARSISFLASLEASAKADGRTRLSQLWVPTGGIAASADEDSHAKLIRAGFLRQAHSGIFHLLPLGRRVQDKLEALIDKHMYQLGASKVSLSSISSEDLWSKSGRLANAGSELIRFKDRKEGKYLLSPTHEEEITSLVTGAVKSYKQLPVRLYQISRKYRDELRPRHGLLRSREFIMKDLYTFDYSSSLALETYHQVRAAYARLFDELKLPYLVAEADSGDIGGDLSHEFHFPTSRGEDNIISCLKCDYVANEELAESAVPDSRAKRQHAEELSLHVWRGISRDRLTLINVWYSSDDSCISDINLHAVKGVIPELDPSVDEPLLFWSKAATLNSEDPSFPRKVINLIDHRAIVASDERLLPLFRAPMQQEFARLEQETIFEDQSTKKPLNLLRIKDGDKCPRCSDGTLRVQKAIELGHTFHLGTRYSDPLKATVTLPAETLTGIEETSSEKNDASSSSSEVAMQMGCHGIGVSRMIGAVADTLCDDKGLNWPRVMAPYEVVVIPGKDLGNAALEVYDALAEGHAMPKDSQLDLILDDRAVRFPWKLKDADLVGYPIIVIVGRRWDSQRMCEVQCRRLGVREEVPFMELSSFVDSLLVQL